MIASILIGIILIALVALDVRYLIGQKKQGKCVGCSAANCHCSGGTCPTAEKYRKYHEEQARLQKQG